MDYFGNVLTLTVEIDVKCGDGKPRKAQKPKPKLTDMERHKRFVETAREVQADESKEAFDSAFERVKEGAFTAPPLPHFWLGMSSVTSPPSALVCKV